MAVREKHSLLIFIPLCQMGTLPLHIPPSNVSAKSPEGVHPWRACIEEPQLGCRRLNARGRGQAVRKRRMKEWTEVGTSVGSLQASR